VTVAVVQTIPQSFFCLLGDFLIILLLSIILLSSQLSVLFRLVSSLEKFLMLLKINSFLVCGFGTYDFSGRTIPHANNWNSVLKINST
jgi:hypothetical protein